MISYVKADGSAERALIAQLRARSGEVDKKVTAAVTEILDSVRQRGDQAVRDYTIRFDGKAPEQAEISSDELQDSLTQSDPQLVESLRRAAENIRSFHARQKQQS